MRDLILKLSTIDRRIIYLLIAISVIIPLIFPLKLPEKMSPPAKRIFDYIESLPQGSVVLISIDYGPSVLPEVQPQVLSVLRHCFFRNLRVIGLGLSPEGIGLGLDAFEKVAKEMGKKYGEDYAYLGFKAGLGAVILGIGEGLKSVFPKDYYGNSVDELPVVRDVRNYNDISLVISFSGAAIPTSWIVFAHTTYNQKVAAGVTAVMAADYFPYIQTGQLVGLLGGMKGAAEYEVEVNRLMKGRKPYLMAIRGMDGIAISHILIMLFIILGNIAYFARRRQ